MENYGEEFLAKHTGVGKTLHKARALQKKHEEFEAIAQVSPQDNLLFWLPGTNFIKLVSTRNCLAQNVVASQIWLTCQNVLLLVPGKTLGGGKIC